MVSPVFCIFSEGGRTAAGSVAGPAEDDEMVSYSATVAATLGSHRNSMCFYLSLAQHVQEGKTKSAETTCRMTNSRTSQDKGKFRFPKVKIYKRVQRTCVISVRQNELYSILKGKYVFSLFFVRSPEKNISHVISLLTELEKAAQK